MISHLRLAGACNVCMYAYACISSALIFKLNIGNVRCFFVLNICQAFDGKCQQRIFVFVDFATEHVATAVYVNNYNFAMNAFKINCVCSRMVTRCTDI